MQRSPADEAAFRDWIGRAKRVRIDDALRRLGGKPQFDNKGGPCPAPGCVRSFPSRHSGPSDRFSINRRKDVFFCRASGQGGGSIALVMHVQGAPFVEAVEFLTGEKPPETVQRETETERAARLAKLEAEWQAAAEHAARLAQENEGYREAERRKAWGMWKQAVPIDGTATEQYRILRGLASLPATIAVRHLDDTPFWDKPPKDGGQIVHRGPAMALAITGPDGHFMGLHRTWIDLSQPKGKVLLPDRDGELLPAKKVRGSKKGGSIFVAGVAWDACVRMFMGEGYESVGAVFCSLRDFDAPILTGARFVSSVDLGNMGGSAERNVPHPDLRFTDRKGRIRRKMVAGPDPRVNDRDPVIAIPPTCRELYLIKDGDSDPFETQMCMERAAKRFARENPDLAIFQISATPGMDTADMRMAMLAAMGLLPSIAPQQKALEDA